METSLRLSTHAVEKHLYSHDASVFFKVYENTLSKIPNATFLNCHYSLNIKCTRLKFGKFYISLCTHVHMTVDFQ